MTIVHTVREETEAREEAQLAPRATRAARTEGRRRDEPECPVRTVFQRDRDRILHSKSFRRLAHKTQVFLSPEGDHYRTRITHTLEVAQISRTIARGLRLNEDLTEAIALGHDLGHTPFGHAGEDMLGQLLPDGFRHAEQSLRVVDLLEWEGRGLNLTAEVRDGIVRHSKGRGPILTDDQERLPRTPEGQAVRISDLIAYLNHDLDDALRGQVIGPDAVPREITRALGQSRGARIGHMVSDVLASTDLERDPRVLMSEETHQAMDALRDFLYDNLYENPRVHDPFLKARGILSGLWQAYTENLERFFTESWPDCPEELRHDPRRAVADYLASMTDRYALRQWEELFWPRRWDLL